MSALVGAPIPVPSLLDISEQTMAIVNLVSLLLTLVGSISGIGFYLERRTNMKFENQTVKMNEISKKIDDNINGLKVDLREMDLRMERSLHEKIDEMEKTTEYKVQKAKEIEDEKFKRIDEAHREHERRLDTIDRDSYDYKIRHNSSSKEEDK
jgi:hypothetical protein